MQGDELRSIRNDLGWNLSQMARELGMSETFVGQMERGQKPIERRTELAARHLHLENLRLSSRHEVLPLDGDIPLADAMILWDRFSRTKGVKVVGHPDGDDPDYSSSAGSCDADWGSVGKAGRLLRLFALFVQLTAREGEKPDEVHKAFSAIPEYREALNRGMFDEGVE